MISNSATTSEQKRVRSWGWIVQKGTFDWLMVVLSIVFVSGLLLDGWAHAHGKVDSSFFTPWHGLWHCC